MNATVLTQKQQTSTNSASELPKTDAASEQKSVKRNQFESFDAFKDFIRDSFINGSGIDPELFDACVEFHQDFEELDGGEWEAPIHDALGWEYKRFRHQANEPLYAAFLKNEDGSIWQAIVSIYDEDKERPYRYLAPQGNGDRAFLPPVPYSVRLKIAKRYGVSGVPEEGSFWEWLKGEEIKIPPIITEGAKKGLCGLSMGYATIALYGCRCGAKVKDKDGNPAKPYLIEDLQKFTNFKIWLLAFDQDTKTKAKKAVAAGRKRLLTALKAHDCMLSDIVWKAELGKGLDDLVVNEGSGAFDAAYVKTIKELEKQFQKPETGDKLPSPKVVADKLLDIFSVRWKYDLERQVWRYWNDKIWEAVEPEIFNQIVTRFLEGYLEGRDYKYYSYLENVLKFLKINLIEGKWKTFNRMEWIAFNDCVLEIKTGKTHEHSPEFGFTSCLEHDYPKPNDINSNNSNNSILDQLRINAPTFYAWAMHAQKGDPQKIMKLVAAVNGVIKFRFHELQMFLCLVGVPGAGKGTFARLLEKMVGRSNHASAKLSKLGDNNVLAQIMSKQLVICPDEKKVNCDLSTLLSLTGGDTISYRPIYQPQANGKFYGTLMVLANSNPFVGDVAGIDRRLSLLTFEVKLNNQDTSVEQKMHAEAPWLMRIALSMSDSQVKGLIKGTGGSAIPDFEKQKWLHKTDNDSIALFMEEMVVPAAQSTYTILGGKGDDPDTLYGSYLRFCENNNSKSLFTRNNFRSHFVELCREIGWSHVQDRRQGSGWRVYGIRLRDKEDFIPHISEKLGESVDHSEQCRASADHDVDLKSLPDLESVDCVDQKDLLTEKNNFDVSPQTQIQDESAPITQLQPEEASNCDTQLQPEVVSNCDTQLQPEEVSNCSEQLFNESTDNTQSLEEARNCDAQLQDESAGDSQLKPEEVSNYDTQLQPEVVSNTNDLLHNQNMEPSVEEESEIKNINKEQPDTKSAHPTQPLPSKDLKPTQENTQVYTPYTTPIDNESDNGNNNSAQTPKEQGIESDSNNTSTHISLKTGDFVVYVGTSPAIKREYGGVLRIFAQSTDGRYVVKDEHGNKVINLRTGKLIGFKTQQLKKVE